MSDGSSRSARSVGHRGAGATADETENHSSHVCREVDRAAIAAAEAVDAEIERAQRRFVSQLTDTPSGQRLVELAYPDIELLGGAVVAEITELSEQMTGDPDRYRAEAAAVALAHINEVAAYNHRSDLEHTSSAGYRWARRCYRKIDDWVRRDDAASGASASATTVTRRVARFGKVCTFAAALALLLTVGGSIGTGVVVATVLIGARVATGLYAWHIAHFPGDDDPDQPFLVCSPTSCVLDHAGDAAVVAAMGAAVVAQGHPVWGGAVIASAFLFVLATLYRVAGARYGTVVPRLHLERMMRSGAILASLILFAFTDDWWWASTVLLLAGPGLFAVIEIAETRRATRDRLIVLRELPVPARSGATAGLPPSAVKCDESAPLAGRRG